MREIKFRAWDKEEEKMKDDFCIDSFGVRQRLHISDEYSKALNKVHENDEVFIRGDWAVLDYTDWYVIESYEIMQYTGLKDKNGKEIYEGDIVTDTEYLGEVLFHDRWYEVGMHSGKLAWCIFNKNTGEYIPLGDCNDEETWEIVGNIWENKELLR